jgi:hypothetical protein
MSTFPEEDHLPPYCRFRDLRAAGVAGTWQQLGRMIDAQGFPPGQLLSPNVRVWKVEEINRWLEARPTARKVISPRKNKQQIEHAA